MLRNTVIYLDHQNKSGEQKPPETINSLKGEKTMMKKDEMIKRALEILSNDDEIFTNCVDELDSWNGYADGFRAYNMDELEDLNCETSLHDFLRSLTKDFNIDDDYFYYSIYGLESTSDKTQLYRDNVDEGDLLDQIIDYSNKLDLSWIDGNFAELIEDIAAAA